MTRNLTAYADDSLDNKVICVGSFIGLAEEFFWTGLKWEERLKKSGIEYFHATDCEGVHKQFFYMRKNDGGAYKQQAHSVRHDLINIMDHARNVGLVAFCVGVIRKDFEQLVSCCPEARTAFGTDPVLFAYKQLIRDIIKYLERDLLEKMPKVKISFVFDKHDRWRQAEETYRTLLQDQSCARRLLKISHEDDREWPGLQIADMVAFEARLKIRRGLSNHGTRKVFRHMARGRLIYSIEQFGKEELESLLKVPEAGND